MYCGFRLKWPRFALFFCVEKAAGKKRTGPVEGKHCDHSAVLQPKLEVRPGAQRADLVQVGRLLRRQVTLAVPAVTDRDLSSAGMYIQSSERDIKRRHVFIYTQQVALAVPERHRHHALIGSAEAYHHADCQYHIVA